MRKHTPGPWIVVDQMMQEDGKTVLDKCGRLICPHCDKPAAEQPASIGIRTKSWGVAALQSLNPKREHDQHIANAHLIAAAPDMNAANKHAAMALRSLVKHDLNGGQRSIIMAALSVLDAAIAKAEGMS